MSSSNLIPPDAQDEFWEIVQDCLLEFHHFDKLTTQIKVSQFRKSLESLSASQLELLYHSEPFEVACDIAHQSLDMNTHLDRYLSIRDNKHGTGVSRQVSHYRPTKVQP